MRKILHKGHLRMEKTKFQARQLLFWPNMNADITDMISNWGMSTTTTKNRQGTKPLMNHEIPDKPRTKVGTDLFKMQKRTYLMIVDDYSKNFETSKTLKNTSPIKHMKVMFVRHGIPTLAFSDNGPEFTSLKFIKFSANWDFEHDTTYPEFLQSNGMVERTIQTVKRILSKCLKSGDDKYLA